ncbi:hypothetical protein WANG_p2025 (plasmid) [Lactobacillus kefiranofaciens subsp. kefiranofaciens]|nr:hypothetical protein WANG_p2025 [Lactobacillus kefiranofaciens subsp. kefiranofaciens]
MIPLNKAHQKYIYAKIHIIKIGIFNHSGHCIVIFIIEVCIFVLKIASTSRGKKGISPSNTLKINTAFFIFYDLHS